MAEKEAVEVPAVDEIQKAYNEYMHKAAEVGQLFIAKAKLIDQFEKDQKDIEIKQHNAVVDSDNLAKKFNSMVKAKELADQQAKAAVALAPEAVQ